MNRHILVILIALATAGCEKPTDKFVKGCEKEISERLVSPSTMKVASIDGLSTEKINPVEYMRSLNNLSPLEIEDFKERVSNRKNWPIKYSAEFQYDSENGFGAMIRGASSCEMTLGYDLGKIDDSDLELYLKIDGYSRTEYLLKQVQNENKN